MAPKQYGEKCMLCVYSYNHSIILIYNIILYSGETQGMEIP